jgi:hypothetical protein
MLLRRLAALACAALLPSAGSQAADIIWSVGPTFGGVEGHLGILTNGTLVAAVHTRGSTGPLEFVDPDGLALAFTPIDSPSFSGTYGDPSNGIGDPVWSAIVSDFEWQSGQDVTAEGFLSGLTLGHSYQVQLFAGRSFLCCADRSQRFGDGNGHFSESISFAPLSFVSIVGTFVADGATQTIVFDDSTNNPVLSAYVLRDVPEPGAAGQWAALAGLVTAAGVARRRRSLPHGRPPAERRQLTGGGIAARALRRRMQRR